MSKNQKKKHKTIKQWYKNMDSDEYSVFIGIMGVAIFISLAYLFVNSL